jgi:hypothetical protein
MAYLLKMDIEGHELAALRGAEALLEGRRISAMAFEFGAPATEADVTFRQLWDHLTERGYKLARIVPWARLLPINDYELSLESSPRANYVATPLAKAAPAS